MSTGLLMYGQISQIVTNFPKPELYIAATLRIKEIN